MATSSAPTVTPAPAAARTTSPDAVERLDVLVVGAGISGIGAAHYLKTELPGKSFAILEGRADLGGTWDLFRYPGIRSDSDLTTFGYEFKPWRAEEAIADGSQILDYLRETVEEEGLAPHIRFHHRVTAAAWSSDTARWLVDVERTDTGERLRLSVGWLFCASGYYAYEQGHTPHFEGQERFRGRIVHPQHWPEDLDWTGKRVVVIGSGATAVTLVPALADGAAHVTMLQRTPTYVLPIPRADRLANALRRRLGDERGHALARWKNIVRQRGIYLFAQRFPRQARALIRRANERQLPPGFPVDEHFNPPYDPWDQRLCAVPDGDLFRALRSGDASVVTDRIATFTEDGVRLESGRELPADVVVTATGLTMSMLGGMALTVDGEPVELPEHVVYRGAMLSDVPNLAVAIGYTNSSWTLKVGLLWQYVCRLIAHMEEHGQDAVWPVADPDMETRPMLDFAAGYVQRAIDSLPRQGAVAPWTMSMSYFQDVKTLRRRPLVDEHLVFASAGDGASPAAHAAPTAGEGWRPDILGDGYEQRVLELGPDPDGEGDVRAVLVRRLPRPGEEVRGAALYVHGFTDYFFQTELADHLAAQGLAFHALDLRKSGRARRPDQHAHYSSDLAQYDAELDRALKVITLEHPRLPVVVVAHSTGGLIAPLWLDRRRRQHRTGPVAGLVLNSPWLDMQGRPAVRSRPFTLGLHALARVRPFHELDMKAGVYGESLHRGARGEWDYDLTMKPHEAFPVAVGWLSAVRRGHARVHRGLEVGVPTLVLHSDRSHFSRTYSEDSDRADLVLDVEQIAAWAPSLGADVEVRAVPGARHDVFLSREEARHQAYDAVADWLRRRIDLAG